VIEVRIEELVVVGLDVDRETLGPAVEAALAARLEDGAPPALERYSASADTLADDVAACLHHAIGERLP
jgi:hypothetical protein